MVVWIYKARMLAMLGMEIEMQEEQIGIKQLMQAMVWFRRLRNMIIMFRGFQELAQLWERQMFSATTAMEDTIMPVIVQNPEFVMQSISENRASQA
ncbi:hypothetical protein Tco_1308684 [Tanacetum coccineum]